MSRLTQARGLKPYKQVGYSVWTMSRLTQARGLKLKYRYRGNSQSCRASHRRVD